MKKGSRDLIAALEAHGYEYERTNSKNCDVYVRDGDEIPVNPSLDEHVARRLIRRLQQANGTVPKADKRKPDQIRERQAKQRQALQSDIEKHQAELDAIIARRNQQLDGVGAIATSAEIERISRYIETRQRELRELEALMRGTPLTSNRAKHRS